MTTQVPPPEFGLAVRLFNGGDFFTCHEVIEEFWRPMEDGPEKTFYQGILQVGVGFYHCLRGNWIGAKNLLGEGLAKLEPLSEIKPYCQWINLKALCQESQTILERLVRLGPEGYPPGEPLVSSFPQITTQAE